MKNKSVKIFLLVASLLFANQLSAQLYTNYVAAREQFKLLGGTYKKAYDLSHQGKNEEFVSLMNQLVDSLEREEDWDRYLVAQDEIATYYAQQRNPKKSIEILKETLKKCKAHVDTLSTEYVYMYKVYWFSYYHQNDILNTKRIADLRYNTVEGRKNKEMPKLLHFSLDVDTYDEISIIYKQVSEFGKLYECLEKSFELAEFLKWDQRVNKLYGQLGIYLFNEGYKDYGLDFLNKSYHSNPLSNYYDSVMVTSTMNVIADVYKEKGEYENSLQTLNRLLDILNNLDHPFPHKISLCYAEMATVYELMEKHDSAELNYNKALDILSENKKNSLIIETYTNLAQLYAEHKNNVDTAYHFIRLADSVITNNEVIDREIIEAYYLFLNDFYTAQNKPEKGLASIQAALCNLADTSSENIYDPVELPVNKLKMETLKLYEAKLKGLIEHFNAQEKENELQIVYNHFNLMNKYFLVVLSENTNKKLIEELLERYRNTIDNIVDFYNQHEELADEDARNLYKIISKGKGLELYIDKYQLEFNKLVNQAENAKYFIDHNNKILQLENQIELMDKLAYEDSVSELNDNLIELKRKTFIAEIQLKYQINTQMNIKEALDIEVEDLQKRTTANKAYIEYHITDKYITSTFISNNKFQIHKKEIGDLSHLIKEFYKKIKTGNDLTEISAKLYNILIAPIESDIAHKKELILVLDKNLNQIPFESIGKGKKKLIENYAISYAYSSNLWSGSKKENKSFQYGMLAVAPVFDLDKNMLSMNSNFRSAFEHDTTIFRSGKTFQALPYTLNEVNEIEGVFQKNKKEFHELINEQATKSIFVQQFDKANIIHIATHGLVNKKNPYLSGLALFPENQEYNQNDIFYHYELYNYKLQADLVVLSACKTGTGKIQDGEGVMSLTRGFIYAGVPHIMVSLWKVHDEKTKDLMVAFYKHLLEDKVSYAEALRLAKIDCMKKGFLPLDWAGFVLVES